MLTRFKVRGFKNLLDLDVRFGPFTCILGPNGVGKSNLFDAIHFISLLADRTMVDAAAAIRDSGRKTRDLTMLFYHGADYVAQKIEFEMELLVPKSAEDDFGQTAKPTNTLLRYTLHIGRRNGSKGGSADQLALLKEELTHIPVGLAPTVLQFEHSKTWRDSVVLGERRAPHFISTTPAGTVKIHQDGGSRGKPLSLSLEKLQRTVLSASNAAETPTILVLKREMQSWLQLQLEPTSLRRPDEFADPSHLTASGKHVPASLYRLTKQEADPQGRASASIANRLSELVGTAREVHADRDDARELITACMTFGDGTRYSASSLSDGTLRFMALAILEQDPEFRGLLCLEEPENGIHPERIPAMIRLLTDLAMDVNSPEGSDNPLRQVIVNTHSPVAAAEVPEDSLLSAEASVMETDSGSLPAMTLTALTGTWRTRSGERTIKKGSLLRYLKPVSRIGRDGNRVADRSDVQQELDFGA